MSEKSPYGPLGSDAEISAFQELEDRLPMVWRSMKERNGQEHTSLVVPSLSVNQEELSKVQGASFYEERLLFTLIRLRNPFARLIYVTSQPIHPDVVGYYLQLLPGIPVSHAMGRLFMLCVYDASPRPLTQKILERPRAIARLRRWIGDPSRAYLTCYNSTGLERRLAVELGIALNGVDPRLLELGTKSGSRKVFETAGVPHPAGTNDVRTPEDVIQGLVRIGNDRPGIRRAVVKLNEGFSGEGNGVFTYPSAWPEDDHEKVELVLKRLRLLEWPAPQETYENFLRKLGEMGGVVEEFIEGEGMRSPSVQMRILPDGELRIVSSHDQVLGGPTGQVYLGCLFPANGEYRAMIQREGWKIGQVLRERGVVGRFGVDFLVWKNREGEWSCAAVEINLRMGGTTPPFMALEFLADGGFDEQSGQYRTVSGDVKYYFATDNLKSSAYRGLLPEDFVDILTENGIHFSHASRTGVLFYMIGALSQYGKLGVTSIGNTREEADQLYDRTIEILDRETGADTASRGRMRPLFEGGGPKIE